jgi:hypothetical protein
MCGCKITELRTIRNPRFNAYDGEGIDPQGRPEFIEKWITEDAGSVDIDTHRFKCEKCGKIGYYSGYGRSLYEPC